MPKPYSYDLREKVVETWLKNCLIPMLKPGQVVIADNATFHKGGRILQLIEAAGCQLNTQPSRILRPCNHGRS